MDSKQDFSQGSVAGNITRMAVPMTIAQLVNVLYNVTDRFFIGHIDGAASLALTGVGIVFPIISVITAFTNLFGMGGAPLCSIARGKKDDALAERIMGAACYMLIVTALVLTAAGVVFQEQILYLFGASADTYPYARDYFSIYIWGTFFAMLSLGMNEEHLRLRDHEKDKLAFYSKATTDFEYLFPFGWGELWGVADRTDYDLKQHSEHSGKSMEYLDPTTNEKFIPYCVEPSVGVERLVLSFLCDAYDEQELEGGDVRTVLHLHPALAPFKVAVMPLQKNKLGDQARELYAKLSRHFSCDYDETGSIGKRYRRQDEIGTPYCICVDFDTEATGKVTVRDRDTMQQEVVAVDDLVGWINEKIDF